MMELLRRNPNYRHLWLAKAGSDIGTWFNTVALAHTTLVLTGSASAVGLVLLCNLFPAVVLGPLLAPWVDRVAKRPLMYLSDLLRAVFALSFALAFLWQAEWMLYLGSLLFALSGVLFSPARSSAIPLVVSREELVEVNAFESGTHGVLSVLGAMSGGIVAALFSPLACFAINSASYLWSAWHISRTRWQEDVPASGNRPPYFDALREGFREVSRNKMARLIIMIGISWGFAGGGYYILVRMLSDTVYLLGAWGIGLLFAIDGIGVLLGSWLVKRFTRGQDRRAVVWYGSAYLAQAVFFAGMTQFTTFAYGALCLLLMRVASGVIIPLDSYLLQTCTPSHIRGRVFTLHSSTYGGVMGFSFLLAGLAFETWGIPRIGIGIGAISLLCGLLWLYQFRKSEAGKFA